MKIAVLVPISVVAALVLMDVRLAAAEGEGLAPLSKGNGDFAFRLNAEIAGSESQGNLLISPFSVSSALAMVYAGAEGETEKQMRGVLCFPLDNESLGPVFFKLNSLLDSSENASLLKTANAVWPQKGFTLTGKFIDTIKKYYGGALFELDYMGDPAQAAEKINAWTSEKTFRKITKLVSEEAIRGDTKLVLTNAVYFNGAWMHKFDTKEAIHNNMNNH